jgi:hypothetical protein
MDDLRHKGTVHLPHTHSDFFYFFRDFGLGERKILVKKKENTYAKGPRYSYHRQWQRHLKLGF